MSFPRNFTFYKWSVTKVAHCIFWTINLYDLSQNLNRQIVGIPMGISRVPHVVDLILCFGLRDTPCRRF